MAYLVLAQTDIDAGVGIYHRCAPAVAACAAVCIKSLGTLSGRLVDVANGAEYELERRKATEKEEQT